HQRLIATLESADPNVRCWSFLPAPSPLAFWARRQAHETGIHRADAESAGGTVTPFETAFAVDGIEELLFGFLSRPSPGEGDGSGEVRSLHLRATDANASWSVAMGESGIRTERSTA